MLTVNQTAEETAAQLFSGQAHLPFSNIAKFNSLIFSRSQYIYCVCYSEVTVNYRRSANLLCLRETKVLQIADYIQEGFLGFAQFFAAFV